MKFDKCEQSFGDRVRYLCSKENTDCNPNKIKSQADLLRFLDGKMTQQNLSNIVNGKTRPSLLDGGNVELILKAFPDVRVQWLLGLDPYRTEEIQQEDLELGASYHLLRLIIKRYGEQYDIPFPIPHSIITQDETDELLSVIEESATMAAIQFLHKHCGTKPILEKQNK